MARVNRLLLTLASGSALYSGMVPALGVGEITLHSALNQPLEAEIELLETSGLEAGEVFVSLAPAEAFQRSGVERFVFLNDLRFTPVLRGGGGVIRVVSSKPVREPYLNFLIEVERPGGKLLREYTLLIDPPGSAAYASVAPPQPRATPVATSRQAAPRPQVAPPPAQLGERYRVARGDSLWLIAARLREAGSQASQQALMEGIHALNPQAFIGGDSRRLKLDAELLLPDIAVSEVLARGSQATPAPQPAVEKPAEPASTATNSLLEAAPAESSMQQIAELQRLVDMQLAAQTTENRQLSQQLSELQRQVEGLQQQLAERDRQIAELQAELAAGAATAPAARAAAEGQTGGRVSGSGIAAGGLLLLLLVGGWSLRSRFKARRAETLRSEPEVRSAIPRPEAPSHLRLVPEPARTRQVHDPLEAADIYVAYGRFEEAANTLRNAIRQAPERLDLQLRLLDVLGELRDSAGFAAQEAELRELGAGAQVDTIKARYAERLSPQEDLLKDAVLALDEESPAQPVDDAQLNLDELALDADWAEVSPFQVAPPRSKPKLVVSDPTFRSNLDELPEVSELTVNHEALSPFGDPLQVEEGEDELTDEFLDVGEGEPVIGELLDRDLEHLAGNREHLTMLNMALAYIEQGNLDSACNILNELISEGDDEEKQVARKLLARIA